MDNNEVINELSAEELEKHYPATFLLLQMSDSEYLTKGAPN